MANIFVITGPSGSGKTTIIRRFFNSHNANATNLHFLVSFTSRPSRTKEVDGVDYFFISDQEFCEKIKRGEFLEYVKFDNYFYGTELNLIRRHLINNRNILLDIDICGARRIKVVFPKNCFIICISAPRAIILSRLQHRKNNSHSSIAARMKLYDKDYHYCDNGKFNKIILNESNNLELVSQQLNTFLAKHGVQNIKNTK